MFDIVLVWKLDRFSRDRYDAVHYEHILKKNGVKGVSATEHIKTAQKGLFWNPCWKKVWRNTTVRNYPRRFTEGKKTPRKDAATAVGFRLAIV